MSRRALAWALATAVALLVACGAPPPTPPSPTPPTPPQPSTAPSPAVAPPTPVSTVAPAVASPTAAPSPTATVAAPATPTAEAPREFLDRLARRAWETLKELTDGHSPRASATDQEEKAARWLADQLAQAGYQARLQEFTVRVIPREGPFVRLLAPPRGTVTARPLNRTGTGTARGPLVAVGRALEGEIPAEGLAGSVALVERGIITFQRKVERAVAAGAVAVVIYNNRPGPFHGTLLEEASVPVVGISQEDGRRLLALLSEDGGLEVEVSVPVEERPSRNVVAERPGPAGGPIVVVGGHYDTVPDVPGANDNGSGIATLLTVAREASRRSYPFALRFVAFGSEELGLLGSSHYVDGLPQEERRRLRAMINLDALASGTTTGVLGSGDLVAFAVATGRDLGEPVEEQAELEGATSDYAPFQRAGIPVLFIFSDDLSRIHTPQDNLDGVEPRLMGVAAYITLALLDRLAERAAP